MWVFSSGKQYKQGRKKILSFFEGRKKLLVLLFPLCICINVLIYMHFKHSHRELWLRWEPNPVHCYQAGLKQWPEKTLQDLKWKRRMDGSRIAVGFLPYYSGALILTAFLLGLGMKAACGEGAVLYYFSFPLFGVPAVAPGSPQQGCVLPAPRRWGGLGTGRGFVGQSGRVKPCPVKLQKQQNTLVLCFLGGQHKAPFPAKQSSL